MSYFYGNGHLFKELFTRGIYKRYLSEVFASAKDSHAPTDASVGRQGKTLVADTLNLMPPADTGQLPWYPEKRMLGYSA